MLDNINRDGEMKRKDADFLKSHEIKDGCCPAMKGGNQKWILKYTILLGIEWGAEMVFQDGVSLVTQSVLELAL